MKYVILVTLLFLSCTSTKQTLFTGKLIKMHRGGSVVLAASWFLDLEDESGKVQKLRTDKGTHPLIILKLIEAVESHKTVMLVYKPHKSWNLSRVLQDVVIIE